MARPGKMVRKAFDRALRGFSRLPPASAPLAEKRRSGIFACFEEGVYAQVWITLTSGKFLTDLALLFTAGAFHLGLINAIPFLAAPAQLLGAALVSRAPTRRAVLLPAIYLCRQIWWLALALVLLPLEASTKLWCFIGLYAVSNVAGQVAGNAWLGWLSEMIPDRLRGRVIASRNGILILVAITSDFLLSQAREYFSPEHRTFYMVLLLGIASFAAMKTIYVFRNQWEPPKPPEPPAPPLGKILRQSFHNRAVKRLTLALVMWNMAVGVAVAFWAPHMITFLKMSFTTIFYYSLTVTTLTFFMTTFIWGHVTDRAGTLSVVVFCSVIITFIPVPWLLTTPENLKPLWIEAVMSGLAWSGFNVAIFNLPFAILPKTHRGHFFAVISSASGLGLGAGALLGGIVAEALSEMRVELFGLTFINYHVTFVMSIFLRGACVFALRRIPDTRSRGALFVMQAVGDGLVRTLTNPRLILTLNRPATARRRPKRRAPSRPPTQPHGGEIRPPAVEEPS